MKISIKKEPNYNAPEGAYRAYLSEVVHLADRKKVRLKFRLLYPNGRDFVAAKNYDISLEKGSLLRLHLASWRGRDLSPEEINSCSFDLNLMIGEQADIVLTHFRNTGHTHPYVDIASIQPPGTLVPTPELPVLHPLG